MTPQEALHLVLEHLKNKGNKTVNLGQLGEHTDASLRITPIGQFPTSTYVATITEGLSAGSICHRLAHDLRVPVEKVSLLSDGNELTQDTSIRVSRKQHRTVDLAVYVNPEAVDWLQRAVHECIQRAANGDRIDCDKLLQGCLGSSVQKEPSPSANDDTIDCDELLEGCLGNEGQNEPSPSTSSQGVACLSSVQRPVGEKIEFQIAYSDTYGTELFQWFDTLLTTAGKSPTELQQWLYITDATGQIGFLPDVLDTEELPNFPLTCTLTLDRDLPNMAPEGMRRSVEQLMNFTALRGHRFKVVTVLINNNAELWRQQANMKTAMKSSGTSISQKTLATSKHVPGCVQELDKSVNEHLLFHGTTMENMTQIAKRQFDIRRAGSAHGAFHGKGIYFSDRSSKSHSYACREHSSDVHGGIFSMLLCRVACGTMAGRGAEVPGKPGLPPHSIHATSPSGGDEIVVFNADQVYPLYMVFYQTV